MPIIDYPPGGVPNLDLASRTPEQARLEELKSEVAKLRLRAEEAEGKLDIIWRENNDEPDDLLAIDYGGTGWEKAPAVESTRRLRMEHGRLSKRCDEQHRAIDALLGPEPGDKREAEVSELVRRELANVLQIDADGGKPTTCFWCAHSSGDAEERKIHVLTCAQNPAVLRIRELEGQVQDLQMMDHTDVENAALDAWAAQLLKRFDGEPKTGTYAGPVLEKVSRRLEALFASHAALEGMVKEVRAVCAGVIGPAAAYHTGGTPAERVRQVITRLAGRPIEEEACWVEPREALRECDRLRALPQAILQEVNTENLHFGDEPVEAVREMRLVVADLVQRVDDWTRTARARGKEADDLRAKLEFLLERTLTADGVYTFPDGDVWKAARRTAAPDAEVRVLDQNLFNYVRFLAQDPATQARAEVSTPAPEAVPGFEGLLRTEAARKVYATYALATELEPGEFSLLDSEVPRRMRFVAALALLCPGSVGPEDVVRFASKFEALVADGTFVDRVCSPALEVQLPDGEPALVLFAATDHSPEELAKTRAEFVSFSDPAFFAPGIWPADQP